MVWKRLGTSGNVWEVWERLPRLCFFQNGLTLNIKVVLLNINVCFLVKGHVIRGLDLSLTGVTFKALESRICLQSASWKRLEAFWR